MLRPKIQQVRPKNPTLSVQKYYASKSKKSTTQQSETNDNLRSEKCKTHKNQKSK